MGQAGQNSGSFAQRVTAKSETLAHTQPESVLGTAVPPVPDAVVTDPPPEAPVATVPDVAGTDVTVLAHVEMLRAQLEQFVTNHRGRVDALETRLAAAEAQVSAHEEAIAALVKAFEAI